MVNSVNGTNQETNSNGITILGKNGFETIKMGEAVRIINKLDADLIGPITGIEYQIKLNTVGLIDQRDYKILLENIPDGANKLPKI